MTSFLISLDEVGRVKRAHGITNIVELASRTGVSRNTWSKALRERKPTPQVLDALAQLGARANRILVDEQLESVAA